MSDFEGLSRYVPSPRVSLRLERNTENAHFLAERLKNYLTHYGFGTTQAGFITELEVFRDALANHELGKRFTKPVKVRQPAISKLSGSGDYEGINSADFALICYLLDFKKVLFTARRNHGLPHGHPLALYPALVDFIDIGEHTLDNIAKRAPGLYRAYRPSSTFPGNFWVGMMEVALDQSTGAVRVLEYYSSAGFDNRPTKTVKLDGFLVRKGRHYTIITRNSSESSLSIALLPAVAIEHEKIMTLSGAILDMSTGRLWGGRVLYEREGPLPSDRFSVESDRYAKLKKKLEDECRVKTPEDLPSSIKDFFNFQPIGNLTMY